MTAKGKINASNVNDTHRIIVNTNGGAYEGDTIRPSATKTGEGVVVTRVLDKLKCSNRRGYIIVTGEGTFYAEPIQTMWLAPEDPAGIKRAYAEAVELDKVYEAYPLADDAPAAEIEEAAPAAPAPTPAELVAEMDEAHEATTAECANPWHTTAPARRRMLCPECPSAAPAAPGLPAPGSPEMAELVDRVLREEPLTFDLPDVLTLHSQAGKVDTNSEDDNTEEPEMTATATAEIQIVKHTGSSVVALIEKVWDTIRADHPELPAVVVTTGSGEGVKWGHFRPESWKLADDGTKLHEFFLASEALAKGATQVLQTTIHEAAHTLNRVRGVQDTSRQGRWHNAAFRKTAEELGLEHKASQADKSHGFSFVTLTQATKDKYADLLAELERELKLTGLLPFWLGGSDEEDQGGEKITGKPKKTEGEEGAAKSGNLKATCGCEEPLIIRLSRKVLDLGVVRCDACEELFTAA